MELTLLSSDVSNNQLPIYFIPPNWYKNLCNNLLQNLYLKDQEYFDEQLENINLFAVDFDTTKKEFIVHILISLRNTLNPYKQENIVSLLEYAIFLFATNRPKDSLRNLCQKHYHAKNNNDIDNITIFSILSTIMLLIEDKIFSAIMCSLSAYVCQFPSEEKHVYNVFATKLLNLIEKNER